MTRAVANRDPFRDFTFAIETPLRQIKAGIVASHHLLGSKLEEDEDVREAISQFVVDAYSKIDEIFDAQEKALAAARKGRSA